MRVYRQFILIITCLGGVSFAAYDVHSSNHGQHDIGETVDSLQKAQEAMLKLQFYTVDEGKQISNTSGDNSSATFNLSKEKFESIVSNINSEVSMLRTQALILSKAYRDLLMKHKVALQRMGTLQVIPPFQDNIKPTPAIASSVQHPQATPMCNCNCEGKPQQKSHDSYSIGNKFYYYNIINNMEGSIRNPHRSHQPSSPASSSVALNHQLPTTDWDEPDVVLPAKAPATKHYETVPPKERINWKKKFFERYGLEELEKFFSDSEAQLLMEQLTKKSGMRSSKI
ncbi:uncharacterized protein LOC134208907 [Armigeres subalbatus]|uniref:uncharacterized protein LOC134208907 n=1 Tax=Armigeres subalbatus TaxID=124917 RepID=UPI002ED1A73E